MKRICQILAAIILLWTESAAAMPIGLRMVFWNNHSEKMADIVVDVGGEKTVLVPRVWIAGHPALVAAAGGNVEAAVRNGTAANGRRVWECYVLGLDPENGDATNDFRITAFPMKADGTPDLGKLVFKPPQAQWNIPASYKVMGRARLDAGDWQEVPSGGNPSFRFFKVELLLP